MIVDFLSLNRSLDRIRHFFLSLSIFIVRNFFRFFLDNFLFLWGLSWLWFSRFTLDLARCELIVDVIGFSEQLLVALVFVGVRELGVYQLELVFRSRLYLLIFELESFFKLNIAKFLPLIVVYFFILSG